jgi:hypothetical protein
MNQYRLENNEMNEIDNSEIGNRVIYNAVGQNRRIDNARMQEALLLDSCYSPFEKRKVCLTRCPT